MSSNGVTLTIRLSFLLLLLFSFPSYTLVFVLPTLKDATSGMWIGKGGVGGREREEERKEKEEEEDQEAQMNGISTNVTNNIMRRLLVSCHINDILLASEREGGGHGE